jgi:pSer/pThr/pTyr-binding forkhead associated (FHA) protein
VIAPGPVVAEPATDDMPDELDRTVVVDRRPVAPWRLVVDGGESFRLSGTRVTLGRRPDGAGSGGQEIAVPDSTRTLSKVHARLDLADGVWTVTDLDATNGVIVIEADGTENLLDPGASAPVSERFVLGKVGMRITLGEDDAAR